MGLGERERRDGLSSSERREPALALSVVPEADQGLNDRILNRDSAAQPTIAILEGVHDGAGCQLRQGRSSVAAYQAGADDPGLAELGEEIGRESSLAEALRRFGFYPGREEPEDPRAHPRRVWIEHAPPGE